MQLILDLIGTFGLVLGVGSSTYALTFFHQSIADGVIDATEKRFLHTVYRVLRIGIVLLTVHTLGTIALLVASHTPLFLDIIPWIHLTLITVIIGNALLMDRHLIPMWLGPAIAGASWYAYFFATTLAPLCFSFLTFGIWYLCFIVLFILILRILREFIVKK